MTIIERTGKHPSINGVERTTCVRVFFPREFDTSSWTAYAHQVRNEKKVFFFLERDGQKYNQTDVNELFDEPNHVL